MPTFEAPPNRTEFPQVANEKIFSRPWLNWFQSISDKFNLLFAHPPSVTGSRGGNVALASLITQLAAQGYIKDDTTL